MQPTPVPLEKVDLADLDAFEHGDVWGMFDTLRREDPVHWTEEHDGGSGFWAITRYDDIMAIDKDPETFTSTKFTNLEEPPEEFQELRRSILESDGPRHLALRKLLMRDFSVAQLRRYEDFLRGLATITVDAALQQPDMDFVEAIAADFPIQVLARLLDTPEEMTPQLISWGNEIVGFSDPEFARVLVNSEEAEKYRHLPFSSPVSLEIFEYGRTLAAERRGGDGDDLVSKLVNRLPEDGIPLSPEHYDNYFLLLVVAGNETTRQAISHSLKAFIDNPDQMQWFLDNPDKSQQAVEELLRFASPVYHFRRTATRDVELHGRKIREGDKVVMWFASGNRDETKFEDPYRLDLSRFPNDHMTFGKGPHSCMGANLARLEIRIIFETLLPRVAEMRLNGQIDRVRSNFVNGIKRFPVHIEPKAGPVSASAVVTDLPQVGTRTRVREHEGDLLVESAAAVAEDVVALTLVDPDGDTLPPWTPGAHVDLLLPDGMVRQYSLCGRPSDSRTIRVGVLRAPDSRGGSVYVHEQLTQGATVRVRGPRNHFPLLASPRYIFIGGGIGITPLLPMLAEAEASGADWHLYYGGRSLASMGFLEELEPYGDKVTLVPQDREGILDLAAILAEPRDDTRVYCCGPEGLLAAVEGRCADGWPIEALHLERFAAKDVKVPEGGERSFDLVLARSGLSLTVPPDRSVFEVIQDAGISVLGSCLEGICGTCEQVVLDGDIDHRDSVLSASEQAANDAMMVCVSRCRTDRLTLDL
jgi:cytochrome P450/ferredoxin-NADP reductase